MEKDNQIISLQLPRYLVNCLKKEAQENCQSVSDIIRLMIIKRYADNKGESK